MSSHSGLSVVPPDEFDEFATRLQGKAERHLNACMEAMDAEEWGSDDEDLMESPAYAPFDGCNTCIVREVLFVALDEVTTFVKDHPDYFAAD